MCFLFFVPKPNQVLSTALSQHAIEIWTQRNVQFQYMYGLQKRALPTFTLAIGLGRHKLYFDLN